jgi:protein TonB
MFIRYASAVTSGTIVTLSLFYLMQSLIAMESIEVMDEKPRPRLNFAPTVPDTAVEPNEPKRFENLLEPVEPDPPRPAPTVDGETLGVIPSPMPALLPEAAPGVTGFMHDGPLVVMIRVEPTYPARATASGLEGFVTVRFDVNPDGSVGNVTVIESSNRIFEPAAVKATRKFRFRPSVVDGIARPTTGLQNRFVFTMESG